MRDRNGLARSLINETGEFSELDFSQLDPEGWLGGGIIAYYQQMLKNHFRSISGLYDPALMALYSDHIHLENNYIQILHTGSNHWVCVASGNNGDGVVNFYDSMKKSSVYTHVGHQAASFLKSDGILFRYANVQQQKGSSDCGLFACAFATALCLGVDVTNITFEQSEMRTHMKNCLQKGKLEVFPHT